MCRGHDVDDGLCVGGIFRRRVGDGLNTRNGVGRQGLQIRLEVLFGEFRRLVVDPNLNTRHASKRDVTFHVNLHAWSVLKSIFGGSCLN